MRVHRVFDRQRVQTEHLGHRLHLMLVGFVQSDPDERRLPFGLEFVHLVQCRGVGVLARQSGAVDIDGAVDHRPGDRDVDALGVDLGLLGARFTPSSDGGSARNDGMTQPPLTRGRGPDGPDRKCYAPVACRVRLR